MNGVIIVNKGKNMTSRDVVNILCKRFNTKKVGHAGTLDPIASGVLVCAIGNYTKLIDILSSDYKEYIATMKLGIYSDTLDTESDIIKTKDYNVNEDKIKEVLKSFLGKSMQEVPKYSAIRLNGKRLYEYARENLDVNLPIREIEVKEIELLEFNNDIIKFRVVVSKGTYIRSLIRDIALKLDTYAIMTELIRTKQGEFNIANSYTLDNINNDNYKLLDYSDIFSTYERYELNDEEYKKVINGQKMPANFNNNEVVYTYNNKYIALYEKANTEARIKIMFKY